MIYSIEVKDLSVFAGSTHLMGPVSFKVKPGGTLVIMGEPALAKALLRKPFLVRSPVCLGPRVKSL